MRWLIGAALLTSTPAVAAGPQCAPQQPIVMADAGPSSPQPGLAAQAPVPTPTLEPSPAQPATSTARLPVPPGLAGLPFTQHVASAGATLFDLGLSHGLHLAAARSGDAFKMFAMLPDGAAAIEGAPVELTLGQLNTIASGNVTSLGEDHGFTGYFVRSGQQFQVFYAVAGQPALIVPGHPARRRRPQGHDARPGREASQAPSQQSKCQEHAGGSSTVSPPLFCDRRAGLRRPCSLGGCREVGFRLRLARPPLRSSSC